MVNDVLIAVTAARAGLLVIPESWSTRRCAGCRLIDPSMPVPTTMLRDEAKRDWVLAERGIDFLRFQLIRRVSRSHGANAARQGKTLSEYWFD
jgi:hypothetical protein